MDLRSGVAVPDGANDCWFDWPVYDSDLYGRHAEPLEQSNPDVIAYDGNGWREAVAAGR
jgi:hypothetical protein